MLNGWSHYLVVFEETDFHTIKSILNSNDLIISSVDSLYFHTIKSILN